MRSKEVKYKFYQKIKCTYHCTIYRILLEIFGLRRSACCFNARYLCQMPFYNKEHLFGGNKWHLVLSTFGILLQPQSCIEDHNKYCETTRRFLAESAHKIGEKGYSLQSYNKLMKSSES